MNEIDSRILAVMVVYNQDISSSLTFTSLVDGIIDSGCQHVLNLLIYDNSPLPQTLYSPVPVPFYYVHDSSNTGLAKAYNHALDIAVSNDFRWLLLLDQDSTLPADFFSSLGRAIKSIRYDENVVAVVPKVSCLGKIVSPSIIKFGGRFRPVAQKEVGICHCHVTSINSGTLISTSFIESIGGFNRLFSLDYLDHWMFNAICENNKKIFISDSVISHELSITNYDKWVNLERYKKILHAELLYIKLCRPTLEKYFFVLRLIKRATCQLFNKNTIKMVKPTVRILKSIIKS